MPGSRAGCRHLRPAPFPLGTIAQALVKHNPPRTFSQLPLHPTQFFLEEPDIWCYSVLSALHLEPLLDSLYESSERPFIYLLASCNLAWTSQNQGARGGSSAQAKTRAKWTIAAGKLGRQFFDRVAAPDPTSVTHSYPDQAKPLAVPLFVLSSRASRLPQTHSFRNITYPVVPGNLSNLH